MKERSSLSGGGSSSREKQSVDLASNGPVLVSCCWSCVGRNKHWRAVGC